ncbi:MAG TPA: polysaccharide pyruvyl transferase family protein, partial [Armatimonadota bacterium]|nr:polysaccharide pyruvyl transferase family protein [Armatimonadota bacterium]
SVQVMREALSPGEWMALAGWTDVVVGMRLHALIFGAARGVPVIGISYDPKVDALLGRLRARPVGTTAGLDAAALRSSIEAALEDDEARRRDREARAEHLRQAAARNVDRALQLLR